MKNSSNSKIIGYTAGIISSILLGLSGVFIRNITSDEYILTFVRLGLSIFFLLPFLLAKKNIWNMEIKKALFLLLSTGSLVSLTILCYTNAVRNISLINAVFLLYLAPIISVGISTIFLKEKLNFISGILLFFTFLGFLFLLNFDFFNINDSRGYLWGVLSAICHALYIVFNRKITPNIPLLVRMFYQFLFGAITMLPFVINSSFFSISIQDVYWLIATSFLQGFLALSLLTLAIKNLKVIEYSVLSYIDPLVASLIGFMFYCEELTLFQLIGCVIIFTTGIMQVFATKN